MNVIATPRDYGLLGRDAKLAEEMGLASAQWYQCPMPRKRLKELMQRRDGPAIRDSLIWFASFLVSGGLAYLFLAHMGGPAIFPHLWRALRLILGFALA